jgi:hypothetical protein
MSNVLRSTKIDALSTAETEIFPLEPAKNIGGAAIVTLENSPPQRNRIKNSI